MTLVFGKGKIGVHHYGPEGNEPRTWVGLAFTEHEDSHEVGSPFPYKGGETVADMKPSVTLEFENPESVQVVIDALKEIKASLLRKE